MKHYGALPRTLVDKRGFPIDANLPTTAFGDLRTAELTPIIQGAFEYTVDNTELFNKDTTNGATITQASGLGTLNTSTTTSSRALLETYRPARYRAGLGGLCRFTGIYTTGVASTSQWIGLMDEEGSTADFKNGFAIGYNGADFGIARFQNDALNFTALSNCDDPLDGTGASGMTIDTTKLNVFAIQFQYLGAGAIQFLVEDQAIGRFIVFHTIHYTNQNTTPSVHNPNFHITFYANNKGTTTDLTVSSASYAYFTEGKTKYFELHQPQFSSGRVTKSSVTTEIALLTIRNKTTYASKTNFIDILLEVIGLGIEASSANNLGQWRMVRNATLGGTPSYSDIEATNSIVEIDIAGTTVTGGTELVSGDLAGKNDRFFEQVIGLDFVLAPGETLTFAVQSANSATFNGSILWKELF